jgi:AraC-like DNA-binding protein
MKSVGGRPRKEIDPQLLERLAACGCTLYEIASVLGCNRRTLERRFADAIEAGRLRGRSSLRHKQFQLAMRGDKTMLIWLGKQYLGQTEKMVVTRAHLNEVAVEMVKALREHVKDEALVQQITTEWQQIPGRVLQV